MWVTSRLPGTLPSCLCKYTNAAKAPLRVTSRLIGNLHKQSLLCYTTVYTPCSTHMCTALHWPFVRFLHLCVPVRGTWRGALLHHPPLRPATWRVIPTFQGLCVYTHSTGSVRTYAQLRVCAYIRTGLALCVHTHRGGGTCGSEHDLLMRASRHGLYSNQKDVAADLRDDADHIAPLGLRSHSY